MDSPSYKQDLPPQGGYRPITFHRIPARKLFSGYTYFAGFFAITAFGGYMYKLTMQRIRREEVEIRSACIAMQPLLMAERDRAFLKQLRINRDEEARLMSNVDGWEVGTLYGEPIYKSLPPDTLVNPTLFEYYAQHSYYTLAERAHLSWRV